MTSNYRGVHWHGARNKWRSAIWNRYRNKKIYLGYYVDEIEAAHAYDKAAKKLHGGDAHLNFPPAEAA